MLMPSIFGENLFDDFFDDYFPFDTDKELHKAEKKLYGRRAGHVMKTDIKEKDNGYEFEIDLPGFAKDEVKVSLENGYMTIEAAKGLDKDEKEKETGKYIRKERYAGACTRSFYVGEEVDPGEIKAAFTHGILKLFVPKILQTCEKPCSHHQQMIENLLRIMATSNLQLSRRILHTTPKTIRERLLAYLSYQELLTGTKDHFPFGKRPDLSGETMQNRRNFLRFHTIKQGDFF